MRYVAADTETFRFGQNNLAPKIVCSSFAWREADGELEYELLGNGDDDHLITWRRLLQPGNDVTLIFHNGGYDLCCLMATYPELIPLVFDKLEADEITDTLAREKLINLSDTGRLTYRVVNGKRIDVRYALTALTSFYWGKDRSAEKGGSTDVWRLNYSALDGLPAKDYPEAAAVYAVEDSVDTLGVFEHQAARVASNAAQLTTSTEHFQIRKMVALYLTSMWGMMVHKKNTAEMKAKVEAILGDNTHLLVEQGMLRSDRHCGAPYKKYIAPALGFLNLPPETDPGEVDWWRFRDLLEQLVPGIRFTKGKGNPGSKDTKRIQRYAKDLLAKLEITPQPTDSTEKKIKAYAQGEWRPDPKKFGDAPFDVDHELYGICLDSEWKEMLAPKDPVMNQLYRREKLTKLTGQIIPTLEQADVIHFGFDFLKETGRTSSYDSGKPPKGSTERKYGSMNGQQVPGEIDGLDSRACFMPRPGTVLIDCDVSGLELASVGHVTQGWHEKGLIPVPSDHLRLYNAAVDLHGYLGAHLAYGSRDADEMAGKFAKLCDENGISEGMPLYESFRHCKKHERKDVRDFFKKFRKLAKPVGLGFPGGLGAKTMVEFARKTYGVEMTIDQAKAYKELWLDTYKEMRFAFKLVNQMTDPFNKTAYDEDDVTNRKQKSYTYITEGGLVRRGASYCAAANGAMMQSPGAEGAMEGHYRLVRECYDWTRGSVLLGCRPINFIHDQSVLETRPGSTLEEQREQTMRVKEVMEAGVAHYLFRAKVRCDEAHLTKVWSKASDPMYNEAGEMIPWEPTTTGEEVAAQ